MVGVVHIDANDETKNQERINNQEVKTAEKQSSIKWSSEISQAFIKVLTQRS